MNNPPQYAEVDQYMVTELRAMLESRGMVPPVSFDAVVARSRGADADALLARLRVAGHITSAQVEALSNAFRAEQTRKLSAILENGLRSGMLEFPQADAAHAGLQRALVRHGPAEFLVEAG